jgi:hypothetical protein
MKKIFLLVALFAVLVPAEPRAETNSDCLNSCLHNGRSASVCVPQCSTQTPTGQHLKTSTDYRCLHLCVNEGKPAAQCMPQCYYSTTQPEKAAALPTPVTPQTNTHRLLNTPVPIGNSILTPDHMTSKSKEPPANIDYACVTQCQQQGMQFPICVQRCPGTAPKSRNNG